MLNHIQKQIKHNRLIKKYEKYFNPKLVYRFCNDYKLPISMVFDKDLFFYELEFFEETHDSLTKWITLCNTIHNEYKDNPELFVSAYLSVRDKIITSIMETPEYQRFNNSPEIVDKYKNTQVPKCQYNMIYNQETCVNKKTYWSFDMKSANYQVMVVEKVLRDVPYDDFIDSYCSGGLSDYIKGSKYFRQVIFGKLNPSRTTKYEKAMMVEIYNRCIIPVMGNIQCAVFNSDEFIIEAGTKEQYNQIIELLNKEQFKIRIEEFTVDGYEYFAYIKGQHEPRKIGEFYKRSCDEISKLRCVNEKYLKLVLNAYFNKKNTKKDKIVTFDKCSATIRENIYIKKIQ